MEQRERADMEAQGIAESDEALFRRVWQRVRGGGDAGEEMPPAPQFPMKSAQEKDAGGEVPEAYRAAMTASSGVPRGEETEIRCKVRAAIDDALSDWQCYRALARIVPKEYSGVLMKLSSDELRHAGRLSAAFFLLTGIRYFPKERAVAPRYASPWEGLRCSFEREQVGRENYIRMAAMTQDLSFRELFRELADEEGVHAQRIRNLVERELYTWPEQGNQRT